MLNASSVTYLHLCSVRILMIRYVWDMRFIGGCLITHFLFIERRNIEVGQFVQGTVKSVDRARKVVHLSSDPDMVSRSVVCYAKILFQIANLIFFLWIVALY